MFNPERKRFWQNYFSLLKRNLLEKEQDGRLWRFFKAQLLSGHLGRAALAENMQDGVVAGKLLTDPPFSLLRSLLLSRHTGRYNLVVSRSLDSCGDATRRLVDDRDELWRELRLILPQGDGEVSQKTTATGMLTDLPQLDIEDLDRYISDAYVGAQGLMVRLKCLRLLTWLNQKCGDVLNLQQAVDGLAQEATDACQTAQMAKYFPAKISQPPASKGTPQHSAYMIYNGQTMSWSLLGSIAANWYDAYSSFRQESDCYNLQANECERTAETYGNIVRSWWQVFAQSGWKKVRQFGRLFFLGLVAVLAVPTLAWPFGQDIYNGLYLSLLPASSFVGGKTPQRLFKPRFELSFWQRLSLALLGLLAMPLAAAVWVLACAAWLLEPMVAHIFWLQQRILVYFTSYIPKEGFVSHFVKPGLVLLGVMTWPVALVFRFVWELAKQCMALLMSGFLMVLAACLKIIDKPWRLAYVVLAAVNVYLSLSVVNILCPSFMPNFMDIGSRFLLALKLPMVDVHLWMVGLATMVVTGCLSWFVFSEPQGASWCQSKPGRLILSAILPMTGLIVLTILSLTVGLEFMASPWVLPSMVIGSFVMMFAVAWLTSCCCVSSCPTTGGAKVLASELSRKKDAATAVLLPKQRPSSELDSDHGKVAHEGNGSR